jgi:hypothetical protein
MGLRRTREDREVSYLRLRRGTDTTGCWSPRYPGEGMACLERGQRGIPYWGQERARGSASRVGGDG